MRKLVAFVLLTVSGAASADQFEDISSQCEAVLQENMTAMVAEDADALLDTISPQAGSPAQFAELRREAEEVFAATDVYMSCVCFKLGRVHLPYADAVVVQQTLPKDERDHYPLQQGESNFRHRSALLPEHKLVVYGQRFVRENGKWKVHLVLSEPKPISEDELNKLRTRDLRAPAP
ncbi:MAG: hypothetical protein ACKO4T_01740 [Planctomycetaceae bacterium]